MPLTSQQLEAKASKQLFAKVDLMDEQAEDLERVSPTDMLKTAQRAYQLAVAVGYGRGIVKSLALIGKAHLRLGDLTEADQFLARAQSSDALDPLLQAEILNNRGVVYIYSKIYDKAFASYQQGLSLARRIGNKALEAKFLNNIGEIYREHKDFATALGYYRMSLEAQRELEDFNRKSVPVANLSATYLEMGNLENAELYARQALDIAREQNDQMIESASLQYLGIIAKKLRQPEKAIAYLEKSLAIYHSTQEVIHAVEVQLEFHKLYFDVGNIELSLYYLHEALQNAEEAGSLSLRVSIYTELARVYEHIGDFETALSYYKQYQETMVAIDQAEREQRLRCINMQIAADESFKEKEAYRLLNEELDCKARELQEEISQRELAQQKLQQLNRELASLSNRDGLTNIANRRYFDESLKQAWSAALRQQAPISLLMIDVDFLKSHNDVYGHLSGDDVIKRIAHALEHSVKRNTDLVARYGGDEFIVLLNSTDTPGALRVAKEIQANVATCGVMLPELSPCQQVTVSIGIATMVPSVDTQACHLIAQSDITLYQAKQAGRDCIRVFDM